MNANPIAPVTAQTAARFDAKFIEDHKLIDRYLEGEKRKDLTLEDYEVVAAACRHCELASM